MLYQLVQLEFIGAIIIYLAILLLLVIYILRHKNTLGLEMLAFFIICSGIVIINYFSNFLRLDVDSVSLFIPRAIDMANSWNNNILHYIANICFSEILEQGHSVYIFWIACIFFLFDNSIVAASMFNIIFGILSLYILYNITLELFDSSTAKLTGLLLILSPNFCFLSTRILRDAMAICLLLWFFYLCLLHDKKPTIKLRTLLLVIFLYLGFLRPQIMLVVSISFLCTKFFSASNRKKHSFLRITWLTAIAFGIILVVSLSNTTNSIFSYRFMAGFGYTNLDTINLRQSASADADSAYVHPMNYGSYAEILLHLPLLVFYFMGSPLPWQVTKLNQAAAMIDSCALWFIYFCFCMEVRGFIEKNRKWAVMIFSYLFIGVLASSALQSNMGAATRHRVLFTALMLPFAAHRIIHWFRKRKRAQASLTPMQTTVIHQQAYEYRSFSGSHKRNL